MNINLLSQQVETMCSHLSILYHSANTKPVLPPELLPVALKELGVTAKELQVAMEELTRQNDELLAARNRTEADRQRYQDLFEFAPDAYLVTDLGGIIREANQAAVSLLLRQQQFLIGKPLTSLVIIDDRPAFRAKLSQITHCDHAEACMRLQRSSGVLNAKLTVDLIHPSKDRPPILRWLVRDITESKRTDVILEPSDHTPFQDRPTQTYVKGEVVPLDPQSLWLVTQGFVKLTTLSDSGDEMLVGLATDGMVFGSSFTSLQTYQAIAFANVQLVSIPLTEISQSPHLAQTLLPAINQRLRQTEGFLAIYGQLRVQDRLNRLLAMLEQEVGQPVAQGTRLRVRLTHQDFASACCTTRVTVTRLLGKLQRQGTIVIDAQNHLIIKNADIFRMLG